MDTLHVFESADPREARIAGAVVAKDGHFTVRPEPGSARAAAFEKAWQEIRARPTLPLLSREGREPGGKGVEVLTRREVSPADPDYLWAVRSALLAGYGMRGEVEDEAGNTWQE